MHTARCYKVGLALPAGMCDKGLRADAGRPLRRSPSKTRFERRCNAPERSVTWAIAES